jgi:hypothetical protein
MKQKIALVAMLFVFAAVAVYAQAPTKIGADKCMMCHKPMFNSWKASKHAAAQVDCETCHGPGSAYKTLAVMKDKAKAKAAGLIEPTEKDCNDCHAKKNVKVENVAAAMKKVHAMKAPK